MSSKAWLTCPSCLITAFTQGGWSVSKMAAILLGVSLFGTSPWSIEAAISKLTSGLPSFDFFWAFIPGDVSELLCRFPPVDSVMSSGWLSLGELALFTFCGFSLPFLLLKSAINDIIKTARYTVFRTLEVRSIMFPVLAKSMDRCIYILCLGALERMTAPETDLRELRFTSCWSELIPWFLRTI